MSDYATAWDSLCHTIGAAADPPTAGYFDDQEHLTIDQRLKVAEVAALLAIAQEISAFNPNNTITHGEDGQRRNGWGMPIK